MIIARLVDPGGGSSRLGGIVQWGLRLFRGGDKKKPVVTPQGLVRPCPPRPIPVGRALAVVRRGVHEILSTRLARNQMQGLAAEMSRRCAFRLMSGPARFSPGLRSRIAVYGFVGLSFANAVGSRDAQPQIIDGHTIQKIKDLFSAKPLVAFVSKASEEDTVAVSVAERISVSGDGDITILSDDDSDFEILESSEVFAVEAGNDCISISDSNVCDEALENNQPTEIQSLIQKFSQENKALKDIINAQVGKEYLLMTELIDVLKSTDEQQKELSMLRNLVIRQNVALRTLYKQFKATTRPFKDQNPQRNWIPAMHLVYEDGYRDPRSPGSFENDQERLRAAGGRVRALKIHRKRRIKKN